MTSAVLFEDVCKNFGRASVLDSLNLEVAAGEFFGLVGVNGAGKTTSIKAMLDFIDVDSGRIRIFGVDHGQTRARERLAFLPERFTPPYYLRGRDFLGYYERLCGVRFAKDDVLSVCASLELAAEALGKSVGIYSKGMSQKLGLVATFLSGKDLLVMDEPMSGLDPKARLLVKKQLQSVRHGGRTVFFSTHMLSDVDELCDRMGILHGGKLRFTGTPAQCREAFGTDSLEQAYLRCISHTEGAAAGAR